MNKLFHQAISLGVLLFSLALYSPLRADENNQAVEVDEHYERALRAYKNRDFKSSLTYCREAIKKNPKNADSHNLLGALFVQARDFKRAKQAFQKCHRINPNPDCSFNLAEMEFITSNWDEAKKRFTGTLAHKDSSDEMKTLARFKLVIIALQQSDDKALRTHLSFFEENKMQQELDLYQVLKKIHSDKLTEKEAELLWNPLLRKDRGMTHHIDSILETYYLDDGVGSAPKDRKKSGKTN